MYVTFVFFSFFFSFVRSLSFDRKINFFFFFEKKFNVLIKTLYAATYYSCRLNKIISYGQLLEIRKLVYNYPDLIE